MMKAIISFIGLISTINASQRLLQSLGCGANEEFSQCNGHCRPTCATGPNIICTLQCQPGCNCIDGYILDEADGTCIPENTCPGSTTCDGENEEYNFCGSACPAVCGVDPPDACIAVCVEGCFCASGYIRDTNGNCISEEACQYGCGVNEVYSPCNGHCRPTCANPPPIACTRQCQPGCNCADGYILDEEDGTCIPDDQCPSTTTAASRDVCPLRCEGGYDGCNTCGCDRLGNPTFCTLRACQIDEITPAECRSCEIGYTLNTVTNTCDSAKVSCTRNGDCDSGFRCRKDPECREYSDLACSDTGKVCVTRRGLETACTSESDCDTENGFGCLMGDMGDGRCLKYQSPP